MLTTTIRFLNIMLVALLAGTSFGIWAGLNPRNYSTATYIEQQQHLVLSLQTLLVSLVVVATLVTIVSAFLQRKDRKTFMALLFAALLLLSCIIITRFGNLPIQTEMLTWSAHSFPDHWTVLRDRWWSLHILRTVAELLALTLVAWTSVQNTNAYLKPQ